MEGPLVSVVMPVYNAEKYLQQAIDSIINQTYKNLDIIIINDGSTDKSREIALSYSDSRLRFLENPVNAGIVSTRNRCLTEAKGDYIAVIDSDDIAHPERIQAQVEFLEKNPEYGMCGSYFQTINGNGELLKKVTFPANDTDAKTYLIVHNCFCHSTVMMRSAIAKNLMYSNGFDVAEDYELWYRISHIAKIINLPNYLTYYRVHGNNISTKKNDHMFNLVYQINRRILDDLKIKYSPAELEIHSNSLHYNASYFKHPDKLFALENWICRLYKEVKTNEQYNAKLFHTILSEKWIVICHKSGHSGRIFFNKLIGPHPLAYFKIVYKKIRKTV